MISIRFFNLSNACKCLDWSGGA